jgi:hypothetical protein
MTTTLVYGGAKRRKSTRKRKASRELGSDCSTRSGMSASLRQRLGQKKPYTYGDGDSRTEQCLVSTTYCRSGRSRAVMVPKKPTGSYRAGKRTGRKRPFPDIPAGATLDLCHGKQHWPFASGCRSRERDMHRPGGANRPLTRSLLTGKAPETGSRSLGSQDLRN